MHLNLQFFYIEASFSYFPRIQLYLFIAYPLCDLEHQLGKKYARR